MSRERKKINLKKMTRKQKILAVVVLAVAVFGITRACGGKKEAAAPGAQAQKTAVVQRQGPAVSSATVRSVRVLPAAGAQA